jgi:hypothetical protein
MNNKVEISTLNSPYYHIFNCSCGKSTCIVSANPVLKKCYSRSETLFNGANCICGKFIELKEFKLEEQ